MRSGMGSGWMGGFGRRMIFEEGRGRRGGETKERRCGFVFESFGTCMVYLVDVLVHRPDWSGYVLPLWE
jgi:hypothetical protein